MAARRQIQRCALLHDAQGRPEELLALLPEIARKGYAAVGVFAFRTETAFVARFCRRAAGLKLEAWLMTGYMKYDEARLARHPEQRLVSAEDVRDWDETECARIFHAARGKAEFCYSHPDRDPWRAFSL